MSPSRHILIISIKNNMFAMVTRERFYVFCVDTWLIIPPKNYILFQCTFSCVPTNLRSQLTPPTILPSAIYHTFSQVKDLIKKYLEFNIHPHIGPKRFSNAFVYDMKSCLEDLFYVCEYNIETTNSTSLFRPFDETMVTTEWDYSNHPPKGQ